MFGLFVVMGVVGVLLLGYVLFVVVFNFLLFDVIIDYCLKILLCVYIVDNVFIGEFGEECCSFVLIM